MVLTSDDNSDAFLKMMTIIVVYSSICYLAGDDDAAEWPIEDSGRDRTGGSACSDRSEDREENEGKESEDNPSQTHQKLTLTHLYDNRVSKNKHR